MDRFQHLAVTILLIGLVLILLSNDTLFTQKEKLVAFVSVLIFSSLITPDIDLKLPFIAHRGPTHNFIILTIGFLILGYIIYTVAMDKGYSDMAKFVPFFVGGAILGWTLHIIEDKLLTKYGNATWFGLAGIVILVWLVSK